MINSSFTGQKSIWKNDNICHISWWWYGYHSNNGWCHSRCLLWSREYSKLVAKMLRGSGWCYPICEQFTWSAELNVHLVGHYCAERDGHRATNRCSPRSPTIMTMAWCTLVQSFIEWMMAHFYVASRWCYYIVIVCVPWKKVCYTQDSKTTIFRSGASFQILSHLKASVDKAIHMMMSNAHPEFNIPCLWLTVHSHCVFTHKNFQPHYNLICHSQCMFVRSNIATPHVYRAINFPFQMFHNSVLTNTKSGYFK